MGSGEFSVVVLGDETELLFNVFNNFELGAGGKVVALSLEELLHPVGEDTTGDLHFLDGVRN